ncbi:MAG: ACP S-malonyltransferase [bacterium]|nr:ACP S-malonyltransferase [bacterium]
MSDKIAFLYPGQGAQKSGMGADFYESFSLARKLYDQAENAIDFGLKEVCFEKTEKLDETEYTQPALLTTSLAITRVAESFGLTPDITAGLSLGEYSAIAAAGGLNVLDAVRLVRARGCYMQKAVPDHQGAMAAILGMESERIEQLLEDRTNVWVANYNCPGQVVITGQIDAVKQAIEVMKQEGCRRAVLLNVSGPFHSPMMKEAARQLNEKLVHTEIMSITCPYITNVNAKPITEKEQIIELLTMQMTHPVLWEQSVREMIKQGVNIFVEIGPGKTLSNFIKKIDKTVKTYQMGTVQEMEQVIGELICVKNK